VEGKTLHASGDSNGALNELNDPEPEVCVTPSVTSYPSLEVPGFCFLSDLSVLASDLVCGNPEEWHV
jgi:hypothetical protein